MTIEEDRELLKDMDREMNKLSLEERRQLLSEVSERIRPNEMLAWRGIYPEAGDTPCPVCSGSGVRTYGDTSTWRGGVGGSAMTTDICDTCWGSGNSDRPWTDLRRVD